MLFAALTVLLVRLVGARKEACGRGLRSATGSWSCVVPAPYLIFSQGPAIFRIDTDGERQRRIVGNVGAAILLDFHYTDRKLYWVNTESGIIQKSLLNGAQRQKVHSAGRGIAGFAVDWIQNQAVWTNRDKGTIERVALDGLDPRTILGNLPRPGSIAVDPIDRCIFWVSDGTVPSIQRTNLDNNKTATAVKTAHRVGVLSLDFTNRRLFWAQSTFDGRTAVGSCDYDGNVINIVNQAPQSHISAISVFLEHLFYTDPKARAINRVNKHIGDEWMNIASKKMPHPPANVKVVHPLMQPMAEAPPTALKDGSCDPAEADCVSVCSSHREGDACRCSAGFTLDKRGNYCQDVNECALWNHGCTLGCVNVPGSYFCTCPRGFVLLSDMKTCQELVSCTVNASPCRYGCVRLEEREVCACPEGSILLPDGTSCTGCSQPDNGGCSQVCVTLAPGRWECECRPGFQLQPDGRRCSATGPSPYLMYANVVGIRSINLDGTGDRSLVEAVGGAIMALDYEPAEGKVYFANSALRRLERANLDGSSREVLVSEGLDLPEGVAVDWIHRKLYWTDRGLSTIERSDLSGLNRDVIVGNGLHRPRGIAIHPELKKLFWTDVGERPAVERVSLDGSDRSVIVGAGLLSPSGLALDHAEGRLYWCDSKTGLVELANLDGSQRRILAQNQVGRPFDVAVFEEFVWVTDWDEQLLLRLDKRTGRNLVRIHGNMGQGASLVIVHPLAKPGANACLLTNGGCDQPCIIRSTDDGTCPPVKATATPVESPDEEDPNTAALKNETLNDEGSPSTPFEPVSTTEKEELELHVFTEKMVSDQDDCSSLQCDANAQCVAEGGRSTCQCRLGFITNGERCVEVDECQLGTHTCDPHAECLNTEGHYLCRCIPGYSGTGFECQSTESSVTAPSTTPSSPAEVTTQGRSQDAMEKCPASHDSYCLHEGVCFYMSDIESFACNCRSGYLGERCQHRDLQWWDLQHRAQEKRCSLAIAACMITLIVLLSASACAIYRYGSKRTSKKPATDEMNGSEGNGTEATDSSTPELCEVLEDDADGGSKVIRVVETPR